VYSFRVDQQRDARNASRRLRYCFRAMHVLLMHPALRTGRMLLPSAPGMRAYPAHSQDCRPAAAAD
jgi:hypothetical protein